MTTKIGEIIKKKRLEMKLKQAELADGICTQATISNLEKGSSLPSISILLKLTERLNMEFNDIYEYSLIDQNGHTLTFKEIRNLCSKQKHKEAYELLKNQIDFNKLESNYEIKQYYYYYGLTSLIGYENTSDGIYYFNQALAFQFRNNIDFLDISALNGVAMAYDIIDENDKAQTYYKKSLDALDDFLYKTGTMKDSLEVVKIYYNTAVFYSKIKKYIKAVNLCTLGINLLQNDNLSFYLDLLFYEKGFNLLQLGKTQEAEKYYLYALVTADSNKNEKVVTIIKNDMEQYNIPQYIL
ncbi:helix-turn-helix domain-containing protein [Carnobacterium gallinarum]|uniref:helix-turn-helix domain-containing protein n=1 Tax=Carnobacterium gallinarum TaxID=2749 RepID=UPI00054F3262|nr:helix-turn-helix transcriptional regulator [Carnobacterium gallinarum]